MLVSINAFPIMRLHDEYVGCFDRLLDAAKADRACFKICRQFKMYSDPALNPCLYGRKGARQ